MKTQDSIFGQLVTRTTSHKFLVAYVDSHDKILVETDGLKAVKGSHSLGQQVEKNKGLWLRLLLDGKDCIILFYFIFRSIVM